MEAPQKIVLPGHAVASAMRAKGLIISYCLLGSTLAGQPGDTVFV